MGEFNLKDLELIHSEKEIMEFLIDNKVIKEKKFLKQLAYEKKLAELQVELIRLQADIIESGKRLLIIFEGRDAAGKGGTIKRFLMNINPKKAKIVALPKPTEQEQKEWYFQRYIKHIPREGEIAFFDRSWYNRAVVEPVFGFCTVEQYDLFMKEVNPLEQRLVNDGIILFKFFLDISKEEQEERLDKRRESPLKRWKIGGLDEQAQEKWDDYSKYIEKMIKETSTEELPWIEIKTDSKKKARLEAIKYVLDNVPGFEPEIKIKTKKKIVTKHS